MAFINAAEFAFSAGRITMKWPDGALIGTLIEMLDDRPYIVMSIRGVNFYADATQSGFMVEVPDAPQEEPGEEHQIEDEENPSPPVDSPFAHPVPEQTPPPDEPLPGEPLAPGDEVVSVQKA
jgi:hypothetical protein